MIVNLRALPNIDIWYRYKPEIWYRGELLSIDKDGRADLILKSAGFSGPWFSPGIPYGKGKEGHWYFANPTRHMKKFMALVGVEMTEDEMIPDWYDDIDIAGMDKLPEPVVSPAFVNTVVQSELENHRDKKNGNHLAAAGKHNPGSKSTK